MSNKIFGHISRRDFIKIAAATTATLAMDWKKIEAIAGKTALDLEFVANDFKPKVNFFKMKDGKAIYEVKFLLLPNSDLNAVLSLFTERYYKEFKSRLETFKLE